MREREIKAAGAPELPAGLFYRGEATAYGMYRVEIRALNEYSGSHVVAKAASFPHEGPGDVAEVARRAVSRLPRSAS